MADMYVHSSYLAYRETQLVSDCRNMQMSSSNKVKCIHKSIFVELSHLEPGFQRIFFVSVHLFLDHIVHSYYV